VLVKGGFNDRRNNVIILVDDGGGRFVTTGFNAQD
jgi:hypothetical protein